MTAKATTTVPRKLDVTFLCFSRLVLFPTHPLHLRVRSELHSEDHPSTAGLVFFALLYRDEENPESLKATVARAYPVSCTCTLVSEISAVRRERRRWRKVI